VPDKHHVFLVPGFFGFLNLGELTYFSRVCEQLALRLDQLGLPADVRAVGTLPTASLRSRAAQLADAVHQYAPDGPLHFVGHSSGGLDCRLLVTPTVSLPTDADVDSIGRRTKSVVTIATPHFGTPLASFATGVLGQKLLRTLSIVTLYALRIGKRPLRSAVKLAQALVGLDDLVGLGGPVADQLYQQVLADFSDEHSEALETFLGHVRGDQALLTQVTPDGLDLFNSASEDRPGVRYASVITRAKPPSAFGAIRIGLDPIAQITHALYHALYRLTADMPSQRLGPLTDAHVESLVSGYGKVPAPAANDGMVPTRSQIWGDIIHIARADHLDVMGYYGDKDGGPSHVDWLVTRSGFDRTRFRALWGAVARHIAFT
jgi:triacylglycerol esterase/lipase EstA (alpha/beta hydrolase family)